MQKLVEYADELVTKIGPRPSASQGEHEAAELIATNLESLGLDTWIQEFSGERGAGLFKVLCYVLTVLAAWILFVAPGLTPLAFVLSLLAFALLAMELLDKNPLARFISGGLSQNVVARYVPEGADPRRKVVVITHYDSARTKLQAAPAIARYYLVLRNVVRICIAALVLISLLSLLPLPEMIILFLSVLGLIIGIVMLVFTIVEIINFFMPYNQGANGNASGVAALMGVAETLAGTRDDAGVDLGGRTLDELGEEQPAMNRSRSRSGRADSAASSSVGLAGVAGSLLTRAKGLVGKRAEGTEGAKRYDGYVDTGDDYLENHSSQKLRAGVPVNRERQLKLARPSSEFSQDQGAGTEQGADAQTADLGAEVTEAARRAAMGGNASAGAEGAQRTEAHAQSQTTTTVRPKGSPNRATPTPSSGIPTENPAIRTRPPLAELQERELAEQAEKEARAAQESDRTADGMPAWFVNAKKAAHDDTKKSDAPADVKVVRSRYADVPVEYKPEGSSTKEERPQAGAHRQASHAPSAAALAGSELRESGRDLDQTAAFTAEPEGELEGRGSAPQQKLSERLDASEIGHVRPATPSGSAAEEAANQVHAVPPTTLNADFSGIDRLASDPLPTSRPASRLPESASPLERAAAASAQNTSSGNDKLKNLPKPLLGDSGSIPTQQAAFDQHMLFETDEREGGTSRISNTGSFAPLGATGIMKPIGEELLQYHEGNEQDLYLSDADESSTGYSRANDEAGGYSPHMVEMPNSRRKSFFGNLGDRLTSGRAKEEKLDSSPSSWLGVNEDFDARTEGSQIGGWENFSEDDDEGWKGGAYGGDSYEDDARSLARFSSTLIDKEVWVVAVGSGENKNAGIKSLLSEYGRELKSALFINVDSVGAGELCYTTAEGSFRAKNTDHRLQGLIKSAASVLGMDFAPVAFKGYNTEASAAMATGARAISIIGLDKDLPVAWRWSSDTLELLDESSIEAVSDVVIEVIKSV